ncbi:hypothetical protein D187_001293 [Cystobacter fuscus DSM 2262]|uniref:Uncharacterized protein n=1 Tax=Cystobacter fuscus (strain ATCC 25194 / DSM 2262 / NBRC 100088 / M29) TaxID=1242864 RepID=S9QHA2_CYSF2|nr:hypothetical protein D187_001293 [Cystobacter fuscus DSM 2262]
MDRVTHAAADPIGEPPPPEARRGPSSPVPSLSGVPWGQGEDPEWE